MEKISFKPCKREQLSLDHRYKWQPFSMKRLATLLMALMLLTVFTAKAQVNLSAATITLTVKDAPLGKVLEEIKKQSGYEFLYGSGLLKNAHTVSLNVKKMALTEVLNICFKDQPLQYSIIGKTVVIRQIEKKTEKDAFSSSANLNNGSQTVISGKVVDEDGKAVERASIAVKGSTGGTIADNLGNFTIMLPAKSNGILIISSLGYANLEYTVKKGTTNTIVLSRQAVQGDEVVIVGMGAQKKKFLTTSVSTITAKDMENLPMTNIYEILNGRVPGLAVSRDYTPGGTGNKIEIRGQNTGFQNGTNFGANNGQNIPLSTNNFGFGNTQPLVLIDGFEGDINAINPQDIETISVLKDASAAIYGIRAANGVILVTTKKGRENSLIVNYDYNIGLQSFNRKPTYAPSWQQATLINEAIANESSSGGGIGGGGGPGFVIGGGGATLRPYTAEEIQKFKDGTDPAYPNTNWENKFFKDFPIQQRHNLSISGGDKRSKYSLSFEYLNQKGSLPHAFADRYNGRFNINTMFNEKLTFNGGLNFTARPGAAPIVGTPGISAGGSSGDTNLLTYVSGFSPMLPLRWANGAYSNNGVNINPEAWAATDSKVSTRNIGMSGNLGLTWKPFNGFSVNPSASVNYGVGEVNTFVDKMNGYINSPAGTPLVQDFRASVFQNSLYQSNDINYGLTGQLTANYNRIFGNHEIDIMVGGLRSYSRAQSLSAKRFNLLNSAIQTISIAPIANQDVNGYQLEAVQQSVFGRLRYNYNDIVVLESTLRSDGNTAFIDKNRYKIFPALSGAWLISSHNFYKNSDFFKSVNFLKIRASWGILGNSSVGYFAYLRRLRTDAYAFNNQPALSVYPYDGFNEDLEWEKTRVTDIGLDARMLKDKLSITFDWYHKQTNGLITTSENAIPLNYGLASAYENLGDISNKGAELQVNYTGSIGKVTWNVGANMAYNKAKLLKYVNKDINKGLSTPSSFTEGQDPYAIYGLQSDGIYQSQEEVTGSPVLNSTVGPGDIRYIDQNHDGKIDGNDRVKLGTYRPPLRYGFLVGTSYKGFSLQAYFRGVAGNAALMAGGLGSLSNADNKVVSDYWERWTPENHSTTIPRARNNKQQNKPISTISDFWMRKASYVKLDNVTLSYNLPPKLCSKLSLTSVRVFYSGQNLLTFAPDFWKWVDPETAGIQAYNNYPSIKNHSFGISVSL
jgi:TonB-linked SusC/RagA family outer membrane protein